MAGDNRVFVDGVDPGDPEEPKKSSARVLTGGILAGVVLGAALFSSTVGNETEPVVPSTNELEVSSPTLPRFGVTALVPGFPDALVAISGTTTGEPGAEVDLEHLLWPSTADEVVRPLIAGDPGPVAFDAAGVWLAVTTVMEDRSGLDLISGRGVLHETASSVTSFAWHDSREGELSYTSTAGGDWTLNYVRGPMSPLQVESAFLSSGLVADGSIAAWGDWGWAIQAYGETPAVWLLDAEAEMVASVPGMAFDSHPSGLLAVVDGSEVRVLRADGTGTGLDRTVANIGPVAAAAISPNGKRLAVLGFDGLILLPLDESPVVAVFEPIVGYPQAAWSSDSRFVLVPGPLGVSVIDTESNTWAEAFPNRGIRAVGVIRLGQSS